MSATKPGVCRYCKCNEASPCRIPGGDTCAWFTKERTVCTAPGCITAFYATQRRGAAESALSHRKRTPGQIHALMHEEKLAKQRARRARAREPLTPKAGVA